MKTSIIILCLLFILTSCSTQSIENCQQLTCEQFTEMYGKIDYSKTENQIYTVLLIDSSKSMEGTYIERTKQATQKVIDQSSNHEYFAIVEFNENAQIISEFSNNKQSLINRLNVIETKGRTTFGEAFVLAQELIDDAPDESQKYVIMLSDGSPEDSKEDYISIINSLKENRIPIYTIAFGEESNKELLKEIASRDDYLYSVQTVEQVENTFDSIYKDIREIPTFTYNTTDISTDYFSQEQISFDVEIFSSFNDKQIQMNNICNLEIENKVEIVGGLFLEQIDGIVRNNLVSFSIGRLKKGTYDIFLSTNYDLGECSFSGTRLVETITVEDKKQECNLDCNQITETITQGKSTTYYIERQPKSWIILLDKSSSMNEQRLLDQARETISILNEIKPRTDSLSLIVFDNSPTLRINHTTKTDRISKELEEIFPGTTTRLIPAINLASKTAKTAPYSSKEIVVLTDGNIVDFNSNIGFEISNLLDNKTCLTTINYGTFLLNNRDRRTTFEQVSKEHCGEIFFTKPTREQIENLLEVTRLNSSSALEVAVSYDNAQKNTGTIRVYSLYTKEEVAFRNETCEVHPKVTIRTNSNEQELFYTKGYVFELENQSSMQIETSFGNQNCEYVGTYTSKTKKPLSENQNKLILTLLIILLVTVVSFIITLKIRLKHLMDKLPPQLKK